jgi:hypothetical protein
MALEIRVYGHPVQGIWTPAENLSFSLKDIESMNVSLLEIVKIRRLGFRVDAGCEPFLKLAVSFLPAPSNGFYGEMGKREKGGAGIF